MSGVWKILLGILLVTLALYAPDALADLTESDPAGKGILDEVKDRFLNAAMMWRGVILDYATWLFWLLVTINLVWTFGMMALQKADLPDFFREFLKFTITTGFFWWVLLNGPVMATDLYESMMKIGADAGGLPEGLSPSSIIEIGFDISAQVNNVLTIWDPIDSLVVILAGVAILIVLALVAINMLLLLISATILAYAGFFFVAFGGSMWTRDMAINFLKTALGLGVQLMGMVLVVGIGEGFLRFFAAQMSGEINFSELTIMLVISIVLLVLSNKVPALLAGIITGASVGGQGIGSFGAGAAVGAAAAVERWAVWPLQLPKLAQPMLQAVPLLYLQHLKKRNSTCNRVQVCLPVPLRLCLVWGLVVVAQARIIRVVIVAVAQTRLRARLHRLCPLVCQPLKPARPLPQIWALI